MNAVRIGMIIRLSRRRPPALQVISSRRAKPVPKPVVPDEAPDGTATCPVAEAAGPRRQACETRIAVAVANAVKSSTCTAVAPTHIQAGKTPGKAR